MQGINWIGLQIGELERRVAVYPSETGGYDSKPITRAGLYAPAYEFPLRTYVLKGGELVPDHGPSDAGKVDDQAVVAALRTAGYLGAAVLTQAVQQ